MGTPESRWSVETDQTVATRVHWRAIDERETELETFRVLLSSMKKRHSWDRIKCAIATGIPAFWVLIIVAGPHVPAAITSSLPDWLVASVAPVLRDVPALWTIAVSLAVAGFQWYNLAHYQRRVIPLVREMYERAQARRDPEFLEMLGDALRFTSLGAAFRTLFPGFLSGPR